MRLREKLSGLHYSPAAHYALSLSPPAFYRAAGYRHLPTIRFARLDPLRRLLKRCVNHTFFFFFFLPLSFRSDESI